MNLRTVLRRGEFIPLALLGLAIVAGRAPAYALEDPVRVVILGSSTAAGANASPLSESWARKFAAALSVSHPGSQVTNLAVGGFTTFNVMPTGNIPPGIWNQPAYLPASGHNITAALALDPDLIIVNLPTNDGDLHVPMELQMDNYAAIVGAAAAQGIPVWIATPQPRTNGDDIARALLRLMVDVTNEAFAGRSIDFWTGIADVNGRILPAYDSDQVHLNNAGHAILFDRALETITVLPPGEPFVAMHPRARTVTEGEQVSFSVIGAGSGQVGYQWQRDGIDLPGETAAILTLPAASPADSGAMFRCVISNGAEQAFSHTALLIVRALPDPPSSHIASDDFSTGTLDTTVWTFHDPKHDATLSFTGTGSADAWLTIQVPGGSPHDLWTNGNEVPRLLQPFADQDLEIEVGFASLPTKKYQMQGLVVQKDSANLVRFDVVYQNTRAHLFAATFTDGTPTIRMDSALGGTPPKHLRLKRSGDIWTGSFSHDGQEWQAATTFSFPTVTTAGGVFAGNAGDTPSATPAFTAQVDYFFNTAAPIDPEDGPRAPVIVAPAAGSYGLGVDVTLQWASTGNEEDSVLISPDSLLGSPAAIAAVVASGTPSFECTGLVRGTTYFWRVRSSRNGVWSPWSAASDFTTAPAMMILRASMSDSTPTFTPDTTWLDPEFPRPGDWHYGPDATIPVTMRLEDSLRVSVCSLRVHWDPVRVFWKGIDLAGSACEEAASVTATVDSLNGTTLVSAEFPGVMTLSPDRHILRVLLGVRTPGRSIVTADRIHFSVPYGDALFHSVAAADTLTTSILLGDVASPAGITVRADGRVDFEDLSVWSLGYWSEAADSGDTGGRYRRKYDFGPTVDGTPYTLPVPDGRVNFDDLMIMASMYGTTGSSAAGKRTTNASATVEVHAGPGIEEGNATVVPVLMTGTAPDVHGVALRITGIGERLISVTPGPLLSSITPAPLVFVRTIGEDAEIDIATLAGAGRAITPSGELVRVRVRSGGAVSATLIDARDGQNQPFRTTAQRDGSSRAPVSFELEQNYPNPFNPETRIRYSVPERTLTSLRIFDVLGRSVATLVHEVKDPGTYTLTWDASGLPSGMYLCRMVAGEFTSTRRLMHVK